MVKGPIQRTYSPKVRCLERDKTGYSLILQIYLITGNWLPDRGGVLWAEILWSGSSRG